MRPIWYGDRRDRVKWGALWHIAEKLDLSPIIQVAYWRNETERTLVLGGDDGKTPIPEPVWNHFSNMRGVEQVGRTNGREIVVLDDPFEELKRREYVGHVIEAFSRYTRPKLLFLDPDTGIQPDRTASAKHATITDVLEFWDALLRGDVLAVYQHASRRDNWIQRSRNLLRSACTGSLVSCIRSPDVAKDVAVLWAEKT